MTNKEMYDYAKKINPDNKQGWTLAFSDVYGDFLIVEKVDEMNVFNDDVEASIAASKYEVVKNWIENEANNRDLISIVRDVFSWDGSLEAYNFYYMDELDDLFCDVKLTDFLSKLAPNFNYSDDGFRDTIYGIESCSMREVVDDIKDNIDEVVEAITNTMEEFDIWIPSSLKEKLDEE